MGRISLYFILNSVKALRNLRVNFPNNNSCAVLTKNDYFVRTFSSLVDQSQLEGSVTAKKKKTQLFHVNLLDSEENKSVMTLENAEKLAKRRNMILIKVQDFDHITQRPTYKLLSSTEYVGEEINSAISEELELPHEQKEKKLKSNKDIVISGKISKHDLQIKINHINKLLGKGHTVKVIVLSPKEAREDIPKAIESGTKKSGTIHSKVAKSSMIYLLTPLSSNGQATQVESNKTNRSAK